MGRKEQWWCGPGARLFESKNLLKQPRFYGVGRKPLPPFFFLTLPVSPTSEVLIPNQKVFKSADGETKIGQKLLKSRLP